MSLYLNCDATWRRNRRYVTSGLIKKSLKSHITRKRYAIQQKLTLIANRKSQLPFRICHLIWLVTPPGGEIGVTSHPVSTKSLKSRITRKWYAIEQKLTLITNGKSAIAVHNLSFDLPCVATWRINRRSVTYGLQNNSKNRVYLRNGAF